MRLLFCGVRGSTPAPGPEFVRVGGHTSCVALASDDGPWSLLLDAGTGIRRVTDRLDGRAFVGSLLLTHLHWDHVQGLPFFAAGDRDDSQVRVFMPDQAGASPTDVLARAMSPPHFPIGPDGLRGDWSFEALTPGAHEIEGFEVLAFDVPHKGGRTFGYRVGHGGSSLAYVPDHHPEPDSLPAIARACAGVDLLVHDAQFLERERAVADAYGHATVDDAIALARDAGAATLALFHHSPGRGDPDVDAIGDAASAAAGEIGGGVNVIVAREEAIIELEADRRSLVAMAIRVVIAEDSYLVREGVVRLLEAQAEVEVVGQCGDFDQLLAMVDSELPDVVLTDIRMPPTGTDEGVRAANALREHHPEIGVVMLSQYAEPAYALALLEHGSAGRAYLLKERVSDVDQLLRAIREVADGGSVIDPKIVEGLVEARARRRDSPLDHLTPREREVLAEMAQGRNNAGIAGALGLSERAVEKHINSLFSKLSLSEETDGHRRVKAVLVYLSAHDS